MAAQKKGLGRGLDALLDPYSVSVEESEQSGLGVLTVSVREIDTNALQPRKQFDETSLQELADSIRTHGIVQPLIVKQKGSRYMIIAGERRFRAARLAGLSDVPVLVTDYDEAQIHEVSLIENIQRENLNPIEEAAAIRFSDEAARHDAGGSLRSSRQEPARDCQLAAAFAAAGERCRHAEKRNPLRRARARARRADGWASDRTAGKGVRRAGLLRPHTGRAGQSPLREKETGWQRRRRQSLPCPPSCSGWRNPSASRSGQRSPSPAAPRAERSQSSTTTAKISSGCMIK